MILDQYNITHFNFYAVGWKRENMQALFEKIIKQYNFYQINQLIR